MPTMRPRISITLDEEQYALLASLAALQGESMSALVGGIIDSVEPSLGRLEGLLKKAKGARDSVLADLNRSYQAADDKAMAIVGEVGAVSDGFELRPPTSNRGVRFSENTDIPPKKTKTYRKSEKSGVK